MPASYSREAYFDDLEKVKVKLYRIHPDFLKYSVIHLFLLISFVCLCSAVRGK